MISGYIGKSDVFDRAIGTFAQHYADQTKKDYELFLLLLNPVRLKLIKKIDFTFFFIVEIKEAGDRITPPGVSCP